MEQPYYDLGTYSRPVSTRSAQAQLWFDRGLIWSYSFNHGEAVRCFERAAQADPDCALAWWGVGYAIGPYYNKQWHEFDPLDLRATLKRAYAASREALQRMSNASPVERSLIEALSARYQASEPPDNLHAWNDDYADAMRAVYHRHVDDPDVCTLFADALMNRTPWALWDLKTGQPCEGADTVEAVRAVETALDQRAADGAELHPGLLHVYIHLLEMSPTPEKALRAADGLRNLAPDAGHLLHMPTHIDVQCGHYHEVVESNDRAIKADREFAERENAIVSFHALSRAHNLHFKLYGAMLLGQLKPTLEAARGLRETIPEELLRQESPPMADWLEGYVAMSVHGWIRFGRWQDLINQPLPDDQTLYCATTAFAHYGKGLAHAVLGQLPEAEGQVRAFEDAVKQVPETRRVFNNTCLELLAIADQMLRGEIDYRAARYEQAFAHLRAAVALSDQLPYDEPWGWMQPARHALGALLLEQGHLDEAEAVYRGDLGLDERVHRPCRHPDNVWALHGLHETLQLQGKMAEATLIEPRLRIALARTDVPIRASCLCRLKTSASMP